LPFLLLDELTAADEPRVGSKSWNCARLKQHGFPVPDGIVIPADADVIALAAIEQDPWFDRWPPDRRFAVRSSAAGEDAPGHTFAGIHETLLNVPCGEIAAAVAACRTSVLSRRAATYRAARGLTSDSTAAAVLIQPMVDAAAAGVAFTIDPMTGSADDLVINSIRGLGAAMVDGHVEPDEIHVRKWDGTIVFCRAGGNGDGGSELSLTGPQIAELARLLVAVERTFGAPQDVEWCRDASGFWIVQSRPVTAAASPSSGIEWTRANLAEVLPELTSPQALDAFEQILNTAERRYMGRLMAPEHVLGPMVKPFYGRLYFNLSQLRHVCLMGGTAPAEMLRSLGHAGEIRSEDEEVRLPPIRDRLACVPDFVRLLTRHFRAPTLMREHERAVARYLTEVSAIDPAAQSDDQILAALQQWRETGTEWLEIVLLFGGVLIYESVLRKICARAGVSFEKLLYTHLAAGAKSVSAQQAFDLVALARIARGEPCAAEWLRRQPQARPSELRAALCGTAFLAAFDAFIERYGHRGLYESDWALPRFAEDPAPLLQALHLHMTGADAGDPSLAEERATREAAAAWAELESRARGLRRWTMLPPARRLLARIKQYYLWREQCRSDMIRVLARLRQCHLVLAGRFVARGWLERRDDYFLLRIDEVAAALDNPRQAAALRDLARARAAERERFRRIRMPLLMRESELGRLIRDTGSDRDDASGELRGTPVSRGIVEGEVAVVDDPGDFAGMKRGAILVTRATDPSWTPLFTLAAGVVVEVGGVLSHASTVAREYGIPALANVRRATTILHTGDRVLLNATEGFVRRVDR
jgi:rifampicin phosphotransferase